MLSVGLTVIAGIIVGGSPLSVLIWWLLGVGVGDVQLRHGGWLVERCRVLNDKWHNLYWVVQLAVSIGLGVGGVGSSDPVLGLVLGCSSGIAFRLVFLRQGTKVKMPPGG